MDVGRRLSQDAPMIFGKQPILEGMGSREGEKGLTTGTKVPFSG